MAVLALISSDCRTALDLVAAWLDAGRSVEVVLLDAAAATSRAGHVRATDVEQLVAAGAVVAAHDEALDRRAISTAGLVQGVKTVTLDEVADLVADTTATVVWL